MAEELEDTTRQKELFSDLSALSGTSEKSTVLLVEPEGRDMAEVRAMIRTALPEFEIVTVKNSESAVADIAGDLPKRTSMIVDASGSEAHKSIFSHRTFPVDLSRIPIVTQNTQLFEGSRGDDNFLQKMGIDGAIDSPTTLDAFRNAIADATRNRLAFCGFLDTEEEVRKEVISNFIDYAQASLIEWSLALSKISSNSAEVRESLEYIKEPLPGFEALVERLSDFGPSISTPALSKTAHDMNNKLAVLMGEGGLSLEIANAEEEVLEALRGLYLGFKNFSAYLSAIMKRYNAHDEAAFNTPNTWSALRDGEFEAVPSVQKLELPEGCNVCVVDDDSRVLQYCSKIISKAGGNYFEAGSAETLEEWGRELGMDGIDVFLLDNDLEGTLRGHNLIPIIRALFPEALIIAHTGNAQQLKKIPDNPYTLGGVEIVEKLQWNEVNRILGKNI